MVFWFVLGLLVGLANGFVLGLMVLGARRHKRHRAAVDKLNASVADMQQLVQKQLPE